MVGYAVWWSDHFQGRVKRITEVWGLLTRERGDPCDAVPGSGEIDPGRRLMTPLTRPWVTGYDRLSRPWVTGYDPLTRPWVAGCDPLTRPWVTGCDPLSQPWVTGCDLSDPPGG